MKNLKLNYFYRDASNYKTPGHELIFAGPISPIEMREIQMTCEDEQYFIPDAVGLPDSRLQFEESGSPVYEEQDDHVFNEIFDDGLALVTEEPNQEMTAQELLARFREVRSNGGWNSLAAMESRGW